MSSNTVGGLKRFLSDLPDDAIVYGYEEVGGYNPDGTGPSAIVVLLSDGKRATFPTGDFAWSGKRQPILSHST